jgi:hypothetical protein
MLLTRLGGMCLCFSTVSDPLGLKDALSYLSSVLHLIEILQEKTMKSVAMPAEMLIPRADIHGLYVNYQYNTRRVTA